MLGKIQNYTPDTFTIQRPRKETVYPYSKYERSLFKTMQEIRNVIIGTAVPMPMYDTQRDYEWSGYENKRAQEIGNVSIIPHVGLKRRKILNKAGINTIHELVTFNDDEIKRKTKNKIGIKFAKHMLEYATSLTSGKHVRRDTPQYAFEKGMTEIFLDLEGEPDGFIGRIYLIGAIIRKSSRHKPKYVSFNAHDCGGQDEMFEKFLEWLNNVSIGWKYIIYHWGNYDRSNIDELFARYGRVWDRQEIMSKFVDLHKIINRQYALPLPNTKLKTIERFVKFKRKQKDVDYMVSYNFYNNYVDNPIKNKKCLTRR